MNSRTESTLPVREKFIFNSTLLSLVKRVPGPQALGLLLAFVIASLTEGIGIMLLVPLLHFLQGGAVGSAWGPMLGQALAWCGWSLNLFSLLSLFLSLVAIKSLAQFFREKRAAAVQHQVVDELRHTCFAALLRTEWRWLATTKRADFANLLLTDINRVGQALHFSVQLLALLVTMAVYVAAAWLIAWPMTLLALFSATLGFVALRGQRRQAAHLGQALGQANRSIQGNVQESLAGMRLAKILGNEQRHLAEFLHVTENLRRQQLAAVSASSRARAWAQTLLAALLALYLYVGLTLMATPMAEILVLVVLFARLIPMFNTSMQLQHHLLHTLPAWHEVQQLLTECKSHAEPERSAAPTPVLARELLLSGISLHYPGREHGALESINLHLPARSTTAVMGPSGAGKSTLADVLMGLLAPDAGTMTVDGQEISGAARMAWRRAVAYVPQDCFLFHDTIRANLLWANPDAQEPDMQRALQRAAADFVLQLPEGLDTVVGDGGLRFSGGERQRLALARALLQRPALLILDEATSALDLENEAKVRAAIENLRGELTVLIIGHRLVTLEHADQVVKLRRGRVEACGTWQELIAQASEQATEHMTDQDEDHGPAGRSR